MSSGKKNIPWVTPVGTFLVAAAATAAATASARGAGRGFGGAAGDRGAEDGKLNRRLLTGAFWAGDFLLPVNDNFFELRFAVVADVFVDGHARFLLLVINYSNFGIMALDLRRLTPSCRP
jgi:hypothetical protein